MHTNHMDEALIMPVAARLKWVHSVGSYINL